MCLLPSCWVNLSTTHDWLALDSCTYIASRRLTKTEVLTGGFTLLLNTSCSLWCHSNTSWGQGAISTAKWGGVRLTDVLKAAGVDDPRCSYGEEWDSKAFTHGIVGRNESKYNYGKCDKSLWRCDYRLWNEWWSSPQLSLIPPASHCSWIQCRT